MTTVDFETVTDIPLRFETRDLWIASFTSQMRQLGVRARKAMLDDLGAKLYEVHKAFPAHQVARDGIFNGAPWVLGVAGRPNRKIGGDSVV